MIAPQVRVFEILAEMSIDVPFVTLQSTDLGGVHSMSVDQVAGARMATRHLIELGHTEIMHISGPQDWIEAEARMQGFLHEINEAELRTRAPILGDWSAHFGYYAGLELLRFRDFSAVFASNDQMALGFMHACRELGLSIPGDMSVVGLRRHPRGCTLLPAPDDSAPELPGDRTAGGLAADLRAARRRAPRSRADHAGARRAGVDRAGLTPPARSFPKRDLVVLTNVTVSHVT